MRASDEQGHTTNKNSRIGTIDMDGVVYQCIANFDQKECQRSGRRNYNKTTRCLVLVIQERISPSPQKLG